MLASGVAFSSGVTVELDRYGGDEEGESLKQENTLPMMSSRVEQIGANLPSNSI